ncbi:hypothetical protein ACFXBB_11215 [Streptomyces scopuliridis]|uniref:hypothetical protein n=1 Tax=Streptomyces scopuliridis TaxID=452529 RepID=UPI0036820936
MWQKARRKTLAAEDVETALAGVPYSLRLAGICLWIKAGVDPVEVGPPSRPRIDAALAE